MPRRYSSRHSLKEKGFSHVILVAFIFALFSLGIYLFLKKFNSQLPNNSVPFLNDPLVKVPEDTKKDNNIPDNSGENDIVLKDFREPNGDTLVEVSNLFSIVLPAEWQYKAIGNTKSPVFEFGNEAYYEGLSGYGNNPDRVYGTIRFSQEFDSNRNLLDFDNFYNLDNHIPTVPVGSISDCGPVYESENPKIVKVSSYNAIFIQSHAVCDYENISETSKQRIYKIYNFSQKNLDYNAVLITFSYDANSATATTELDNLETALSKFKFINALPTDGYSTGFSKYIAEHCAGNDLELADVSKLVSYSENVGSQFNLSQPVKCIPTFNPSEKLTVKLWNEAFLLAENVSDSDMKLYIGTRNSVEKGFLNAFSILTETPAFYYTYNLNNYPIFVDASLTHFFGSPSEPHPIRVSTYTLDGNYVFIVSDVIYLSDDKALSDLYSRFPNGINDSEFTDALLSEYFSSADLLSVENKNALDVLVSLASGIQAAPQY